MTPADVARLYRDFQTAAEGEVLARITWSRRASGESYRVLQSVRAESDRAYDAWQDAVAKVTP